MAGMRTVEELLSATPRPLSTSPCSAPSRMSTTTASCSRRCWRARRALDDIVINPAGLVRGQRHHSCIAGEPVARIDRAARRSSPRPAAARALRPAAARHRLATRSSCRFPASDLPGRRAPFATSTTSDRCSTPRAPQARAVVIGGGLLGLEAAYGLKQRGMTVAVVHLMPTLMERQLDAAAGQLLQRDLDRARHRLLHQRPDRGDPRRPTRSRACSSPTARRFRPTWWCMAVGIRPEHRPGRAAGLDVNRGVMVVRRHAHQRPAIFSRSANAWSTAARCSAWWRRCGIRPRSAQPSSPATRRRCSPPRALSTSLKITGIDVFSAGALTAADDGRRRDHAARRLRAASTRSSCCATASWSAPCSTATSPTAPGTCS